jgi:hypothetical protein
VLRVVPGTIAHTKEVTGLTRLNERRGPVDSTSTGPLRRRRTAFSQAMPGDRPRLGEGSDWNGELHGDTAIGFSRRRNHYG